MDYEASILNENGQSYTAATAPSILTTGAAGYSEQSNKSAGTSYAKYSYISIACGNRGKQSQATDASGNTYYTGDAPLCLVDQKNAVRFVKYNMLLGNLPGNVDYFVSTGGSGGGAHAAMFAATSNYPDFYPYQAEAGSVGVYENADGSFTTTVSIDGTEQNLSDGACGTVAYSAITSLYEADMAQAFEYYLDASYTFNTSFQEQLAAYLSEAHMKYINEQNLSVAESAVALDINKDGDTDDTVDLRIEYDAEKYPENRGYYGSYLDLYLAQFEQNLQWYLDNLDYSTDWTWFNESGTALSDEETSAMTIEDKKAAFLAGRYAKTESRGGGMGMGTPPSGATSLTESTTAASGNDTATSGSDTATSTGETATVSSDTATSGSDTATSSSDSSDVDALFGTNIRGGGPGSGSTASSGASVDSTTYADFSAMAQAYAEDVAEIEAGDKYGNNIVALYNPLLYIGNSQTQSPTWTRLVMGGSEGDIPMMASLNLHIGLLNSGVDSKLEWQWNGGHVPSEIFGNSLALYVDQMYGKYVNNKTITKAEATAQSANGTETAANGTDIRSWVNTEDLQNVSFTLAGVLAYRNQNASKAVPGFDTIDYGQEDYEFGSRTKDARHWNAFLNEIFSNEEYRTVLSELFVAELSAESTDTESTSAESAATQSSQ